MPDLSEARRALLEFRDTRDWRQFHKPKDLAAALSIEAGELLECFLWKDDDEPDPEGVRGELADVLSYALLLADHYGLDPAEIILEKIRKNESRYPVEKAKGNAKKHDEL